MVYMGTSSDLKMPPEETYYRTQVVTFKKSMLLTQIQHEYNYIAETVR